MLLDFYKKYRLKRKIERVYRIVVYYVNGNKGTGSGFFVNNDSFITCFHVAFGSTLKEIRTSPAFLITAGKDEHEKIKNYYKSLILRTEIELHDGSRLVGELKKFDEKYDCAILEVDTSGKEINISDLDFTSEIELRDYVFFAGYPTHHDYDSEKLPLAVQEGMISSFVETSIAGDKYEHLLLNAINLPGNSGAPLFKKSSNKVIGIINGNMNFGYDSVMIEDPKTKLSEAKSFRVPLSIAYATSFKVLKEKSTIFF